VPSIQRVGVSGSITLKITTSTALTNGAASIAVVASPVVTGVSIGAVTGSGTAYSCTVTLTGVAAGLNEGLAFTASVDDPAGTGQGACVVTLDTTGPVAPTNLVGINRIEGALLQWTPSVDTD